MTLTLETTLSPTHPFPGLRPFDSEDRDYFFGRDDQKYALYRLLDRNRFVAVVGSSGSGKSSLVRAALLPLLEDEAKEEGGTKWRTLTMQPGDHPLETLAEKMATLAVSDEPLDAGILLDHIRTELEASSFGLRRALDGIPGVAGARILLVIDQFEEIFRFADAGFDGERTAETSARDEEATKFVQLLLEATRSHTSPISVLITMRSDFIGDCAQFQRLPEAVSSAQFLVPSLTPDQMEQVIREPLKLANGSIETALVEQLLNDAAHENDQLPVLQHCLQRLWSIGAPDLRIEHYNDPRIGGLPNCLSRHADEVMADLTGKELAVEQTFRALSKVDKDGRATRRALHFDQLLAETGVPRDDLIAVVDRFRADDCSFLVPSKSKVPTLSDETRVDVVHEALLRRWQRISSKVEPLGWLWAEDQDARDFRVLTTLAEAAGPTGHVTLPLEQVETMWQKWRSRPRTSAWAERYGGNLARVEKMFSDSLALAQQEEQRKKEEQQRREEAALAATQMAAARRLARRTAMLAAAMGAIALVAVFGFVLALWARGAAETQARAARDARAAADAQRAQAIIAANNAKRQRQLAIASAAKAEAAQKKADAARKATQVALAQSEVYRQQAQQQATLANQQAAVAQKESARANRAGASLNRAMQSMQLAEVNDALFTNVNDYDLRTSGLIAVDAYVMGNTYNALNSLLGDALMNDALGRVALPPWSLGASVGHDDAFAVLTGAPQAQYGRLVHGTLAAVDETTYGITARRAGVSARFLCGLDQPARAVVASDSSIDFYSISPAIVKEASIPAHVRAMACASAAPVVAFVDERGALRLYDAATQAQARVVSLSAPLSGLKLSPDAHYAAAVSSDGVISMYDLNSRALLGTRPLTELASDCPASGDCSHLVDFNNSEAAFYDNGTVYVTDLHLNTVRSYKCSADDCSRPAVTFANGAAAPLLLADGVLSPADTYQKEYGGRQITGSPIIAPHRKMFASTFPDAMKTRPNPYGAGLAGHAFTDLRYPLLGTREAPQWDKSYSRSGHALYLPTKSGYEALDLDRLRHNWERPINLSYHVRVRDTGDGQHAVAFDWVLGRVQVLRTGGSDPTVLHQFNVAPVATTSDAQDAPYLYSVDAAYDPDSGIVTMFSHSASGTPKKNYAVLRRYRADGTLVSTISGQQLLAHTHARVNDISTWMLSSRGRYVIARTVASKDMPDYLLRPNGSVAGVAYAIRGISDNERIVFALAAKHDPSLSLMQLPQWKAYSGMTPVETDATSEDLSSDGHTVAYWSYDASKDVYSLHLYNADSRMQLAYALPKLPDIKYAGPLSFSDDGRYLIASYTDTQKVRRLAFYAVDPKAWARAICLMAGRPLKPSEFKTIAPDLKYIDGCAPYESEMYR